MKKFAKDLDQLKQIRAQNRLELLAANTTPPEAAHQVVSTSQGSDTLGAYLTKLELRKIGLRNIASKVSNQALPAVSPIDEQEEAKKFVTDFKARLSEISKDENDDYKNNLAAFKLSLENKLDTPGNPVTANALKYGGAAVPLAGSLLQNNGADPTSSIAGASTGALPALAMVGAAGAAGMAMGSKSVSGSDGGSSLGGAERPVTTPTNKTDGTEFGGDKNAQGPAPLPASPLGSTETNKGEKSAETNTAVASNGALAAALGGGASLMPGKSKKNRDVASATPSTAAGGDEALKPFAGDLRPAPRPSSSPDTAGNDVSNLLGKMKDLFNMDETFGGDMPPAPDMSAGSPAHPAGGGPAGDEYVGDDYSGSEDYQAGEDYSSGEEETYQGSNPMGDIEVTLFRRVHARHVKCMEKGLVLLMSQELPE
jgi:hypothetical protein